MGAEREWKFDRLNWIVQDIVDKIIFLRIAEDKGIEKYGGLETIAKGKDIWKSLVKHFESSHKKYNSGLFDNTSILAKFTLDDKVLKNIINSLYYPCPYEFSVLGVDILGNIYEKYWESITGDVYIKKPMGPVPKNIDGVVALMQQSGMIQEIENNYHGYKQIKYIPNTVRDKNVFNQTEIEELGYAINNYSDKTGKQLTDFSHGDIPFKATKEIGEEISYGLAHYREGIYSVSPKEEDADF